MKSHPPRPPFALGIGVIGHRPNRLPEAARDKVQAEIARVLNLIAKEAEIIEKVHGAFFAKCDPILTLVSALAEGADRMAAEVALAQGYKLDVPLPFTADIYEDDFETAGSRAEFQKLLSQARHVLILPGRVTNKPLAYESAAHTVLAQSDILLTIWDGGASAGRGGTTDILSKAARSALPIIHIDATGTNPTCLLWNERGDLAPAAEFIEDMEANDFDEVLPSLLDQLVRPPAAPHERKALTHFLKKRSPHVSLRPEFPLLMAMLGVRRFNTGDIALSAPTTLTAGYNAARSKATAGEIDIDDPSILAHAYGWADGIAVQLSQTFRGAFISNFILAALSVVVAAYSLIAHDPGEHIDLAQHKWPFVATELTLIVLVIFNTAVGKIRDWHRRWLEARELAERFRAALPLWVLGLRPTVFSGAEPTWTGWYSRATIRAEGLRPGDLEEHGLALAKEALIDLLRDQSNYNNLSEERMKKMDRRLERVGVILLTATVFIAFAFLAAVGMQWPIPDRYSYGVTAAAAALPALATATYGIRVIGDFEGIARRAERTRLLLQQILKATEKDKLDLALLRARTRATADALLGDVASWRLAVESRGLNVPG